MRETHQTRDYRGEHRIGEVSADEGGVVGEERRIETVLDACDIKAAVLCERVIAVDEEGAEGEGQKQRVMPRG